MTRHVFARPFAAVLLACAALAAYAAPAAAQVARAFAPRYTFNGSGSITLTGNTTMTCSGNCASVQNGTSGGNQDNDNKTMVYVDIDADATTFASSNATLTIPPGATVLWAGLYWGGVSASAQRNTVRFAAPGGGYATLTAQQLDAIGNVYQGFREITAQVTASGTGVYTVANVHSTAGSRDVWGGWSIVVAYRLDSITARNLVVGDGFLYVRPGNPLNFNVSGFLTPPTGIVQSSVGLVAWDGDISAKNEDFVLNSTVLSDALNPANNVYNSTISLAGAPITARTPNYANTLGLDADILEANGILGNGTSSASISMTSASDRYYAGVITFNTEIYLPRFDAANFTKTVTDLNGGDVRPGDILEYVVTATNAGTDAAGQVVVRDTLPATATYVAGSMQIVLGPNAGAKTDAIADDQMDFDPSARAVVARLGTGANGASGGQLGIGESSAVRFRIQVTPPAPSGTQVFNQAAISCIGVIQGVLVEERSDGDPLTAGAQPTIVTTTSVPLSGTVFEDVHFGGGAGRSLAASGGAAVAAARVELYDVAGDFLAATLTDSAGGYAFDGWAPGVYLVRVVNGTVRSTRPGSVAGLIPVQTFRTDATTGAALPVTDRVGGENPVRFDAPANLTNATFSSLQAPPYAAQSAAPVTLGLAPLSGVDFGFNFSTIVNVHDAGQGSLRQFMHNANALGNAGLAQAGLPAGLETSVFMISDGLAHAGLRAGTPNQLGNGVARILVLSPLPALTDPGTRIDGTTQTALVGDTNPALLGMAGAVGADALPLAPTPGPEVEIRDGVAVAIGLDLQAPGLALAGVALRGFGNATGSNGDADVRIGASAHGVSIQDCVIGAPAASFADSGAVQRSGGDHVRVLGADGGMISGTRVGFGAGAGVAFTSGSDGWQIEGSELRGNAITDPARAAVSLEASASLAMAQSLVALNAGAGVDAATGGGSSVFTNVTFMGNGMGSGAVTAGLRLAGAGGTIDRCIVRDHRGAGVMVAAGATNHVITRSLFSGNGDLAGPGGPATGQIGIDLLAAGDAPATGTAPYVTRNDAGDADAGGNALLNFPVIEAAVVRNGVFTLTGWARPGSAIELFVADGDASGFGEGMTYLTALTEGSGADLDGAVTAYAPPINGLDQGSDATQRFRFTLPLPAGVNPGMALTATATLAGVGTSEFSGRVLVTTGVEVSGFAYADGDHDAARDPAEAGTGVALFLKLVANDGTSASQVAAANPATGAYVLSFVNAGTYDVVLDTSPDPNDLTPDRPAGWLGTEAPAGVRVGLAVTGTDALDQNFGLWHGARVEGSVFRDDGAGGGAPNDGVRQPAESGVANVRVRALSAACAGGACDSTLTDGAGAYALWIPFAATGANVTVSESNLAGWVSTGGDPGTSGGTYARGPDAIVFIPAAGGVATGAGFGDVPPNTFVSPGAQTVFPGGFTAYAHRFTAGSAGSVSLSAVQAPAPAIPGWSVTLVHDLDCNGAAEPGEPVLAGALPLSTGEQLCIVARHTAPAGAPAGATEVATLTASFSYAGAAPPLSTAHLLDDVTTVVDHGLRITKSVDLASARPGDALTYTIQYTNTSSQPLSNIVIHDATPAYTTFGSAGCGALGSGLTGCSVTQQPGAGATGSVRWTLAGTLDPGASGSVTFVVTVE